MITTCNRLDLETLGFLTDYRQKKIALDIMMGFCVLGDFGA